MIRLTLKILVLLIIGIYAFLPYYLPTVVNFALKDYGVKITTLDINYPSFKGIFIRQAGFSYQSKKINAKNIDINYLWQGLLPTNLKISVDKINYADTVNGNTTSPNLVGLCWLPKQIKKININKAVVNNRIINDIIFAKDSKKIRFSGNVNKPVAVSLSGACNQNKLNADLFLTQDNLAIKAKISLIAGNNDLGIKAKLLVNEIKGKIKASYNFLDKKTKVKVAINSVELTKLKSLLSVYTNVLDKLKFSGGKLNADIAFSMSDELLKNSQYLQGKDIPEIDYNFEIKEATGSYDKYKFNNAKIVIKGIYDDELFADGYLKIDSSDGIVKLNDINTNINIKQRNGQTKIKLSNVGAKLLGGYISANKVIAKYPSMHIKSQLALQDIDLEKTAQAFDFEDVVKVDGAVKGGFNVEYSDRQGVNINGQLSNQSEGDIMYPNNIDFLAFLKNLHYKKIKILSKFSKNILKIDVVELQGNDNLNTNTSYTIEADKPISIKFKVNF